MRELGQLFCVGLVLILFVCLITLTAYWDYHSDLKERCEKENDVYQCELVAVPVEGESQ